MRINKVHTIAELKAIFTEAAPKHVCLINQAGGTEVFYNQAKKGEVESRFADIVKKLRAKTTIPGMYFVCFKNAFTPNAVVTEYPINVGNENNSVTITPMNTTPSQSVWSVTEAIAIIGEKNRLELMLDFEKQTNAMLNERIKDLEAEILQLSQGTSGAGTWVKDLEVFKPLAEIFFTQRDKALQLEEKKLSLMEGKPARAARPDGGMELNDPNYQSYFEAIVKSGNEDDLNHELDYVETASPQLYQQLIGMYNISEENNPAQ